jgi:hypothetical protein
MMTSRQEDIITLVATLLAISEEAAESLVEAGDDEQVRAAVEEHSWLTGRERRIVLRRIAAARKRSRVQHDARRRGDEERMMEAKNMIDESKLDAWLARWRRGLLADINERIRREREPLIAMEYFILIDVARRLAASSAYHVARQSSVIWRTEKGAKINYGLPVALPTVQSRARFGPGAGRVGRQEPQSERAEGLAPRTPHAPVELLGQKRGEAGLLISCRRTIWLPRSMSTH